MLPAVRPSLPSWCAPLTAAFEGSFFALCAVVAVSPASQVGLIDRAPVGEVGRQSSLATKAVVWLWMVAPSTFRSAASRERQERPVSALVIVVVLAATGFAPTPREVFSSSGGGLSLPINGRTAATCACGPGGSHSDAGHGGTSVGPIPVLCALWHPCLAGFSSSPASSLRRRAVAIPSSR